MLDDNVQVKKEQAVQSSMFSKVSYDFKTNVLEVTFKNGRVYTYTIPVELYYQFMDAESKGKFFNANIKHLGSSRMEG